VRNVANEPVVPGPKSMGTIARLPVSKKAVTIPGSTA